MRECQSVILVIRTDIPPPGAEDCSSTSADVEVSEEQVDGEGRGEHDGATTRSPPQRVEENSHHQASTSEGGFGEGRGVFWLGVDPERGGVWPSCSRALNPFAFRKAPSPSSPALKGPRPAGLLEAQPHQPSLPSPRPAPA